MINSLSTKMALKNKTCIFLQPVRYRNDSYTDNENVKKKNNTRHANTVKYVRYPHII